MPRELDDITGDIVDAAMKLHTRLGPGLRESVYDTLLGKALEQRGLRVDRQHTASFELDGVKFRRGLTIDLLVERQVAVEVKSVDKIAVAHRKQVLTYLRLLDLRVGLLINFGSLRLKDGIRRIVNGYEPGKSSHLRINQRTDAPPRSPK